MFDPECPVCRTAEVISGKWTLLIIRDLADSSLRFCELERSLRGISPRTLSLRLRALEEQGVVERRTYPEVPPRVTYETNVLAGDVDSQLTPFPNIDEMTTLPSPDKPVLVYFGLSSDHSHALFLVSNKVAALAGPGTCVPAPDDCALLSLGAGQSEDLQYAGDGKTYRVVVAEIKRFTK